MLYLVKEETGPEQPLELGCRAILGNPLGLHLTVLWYIYCTGKDFSQVPLRTGHSPPEPKYSGRAVLGCGIDHESVCKCEGGAHLVSAECEDIYMHTSTHVLLIQSHV